ncbi:MAG: HD domain-containing phosphohydrolase [Planctomycetota bacterium]
MKRLSLDFRFLRSKVALRIFLLFVVCALLPMSALAYLAFTQVTSQLTEQADQRLHQACKSVGMTLFERLRYLEADLKLIAASLGSAPEKDLEFVKRELGDRLQARFERLVLMRPGASAPPVRPLDASEEEHLQAGHSLLIEEPQPSQATLWLARALSASDLTRGRLYGEIDQGYLWGGDGFVAPSHDLVIATADGTLLFSTLPDRAAHDQLALARSVPGSSGRFEWASGGETFLGRYWSLYIQPQFHTEWVLTQSQARSAVLSPVENFRALFLRLTLLAFSLVILLSITQLRRSLVPIALLREATQRIATKDFGFRVRIKGRNELAELATSFNRMAESMESHVRSMGTLNRIGISLSSEKNVERLAQIILTGAKELTGAEGGALYLSVESKELQLAMVDIDPLNLSTGIVPDQKLPLCEGANERILATATARQCTTINIPDLEKDDRFDATGNPYFDQAQGYRPRSLLSVPMRNHENEVIGVLQLVNAREKYTRTIIPFSREAEHLAESLASQAAVAFSTNELIESFKRLFDALAELIARAIDQKSPYTGDHCRRVPVLTMMLADAACETQLGPLKDFTLSAEERYELQIASLLHDCGKVVTPVHVVDKSTKLQTICDRIDLVETRFELIRRDLELTWLRENSGEALARGSAARAELERSLELLEQERAFIRRCNIGEEFMSDVDRGYLEEVARKYTWIDDQGVCQPLLTDNEIYNLSVPRGTLTPEEREIINHHVVATINMLEALPYPKSLRNVPRIVAAHHERMDGRGYPNGLTREEIPIQGRILGIADVFEALTARDRPYKKAKRLSEALRILRSMADDGHIDPDLFDVFIREGVYLRYAREYLAPEQVDWVDVADLLRPMRKRASLPPQPVGR